MRLKAPFDDTPVHMSVKHEQFPATRGGGTRVSLLRLCYNILIPQKERRVALEREKQELIEKVGALIDSRYGGDYKTAFDHYANKRTESGSIDSDELSDLLGDAEVGNVFTRGMWVSGIMSELDKDKDGFITYSELQAIAQEL
jgi:hypothetical protein